MTQTPTLGLTMPGLDSPANISVIDKNMEILDLWAKEIVAKLLATSKTNFGIVKIGNGINVADGVISVPVREGLVGVGQVMITFSEEHPAITYPGTTWQKIEERFLMGTTGNEKAGATGGNKEVSLTADNNGPHNHLGTQIPHGHGKGNMEITGQVKMIGDNTSGAYVTPEGAFGILEPNSTQRAYGYTSNKVGSGGFTFKASKSWSGSTTDAAPTITIANSGKGTPFSILPPFVKAHIWKRLS